MLTYYKIIEVMDMNVELFNYNTSFALDQL